MTTIHELMHVAVKGRKTGTIWAVAGDEDYADAAAHLAGDKNSVYTEANDKVGAASAYWGARLNQACGYRSHITREMTNYILYKKVPTQNKPEVPIQKTFPGTVV